MNKSLDVIAFGSCYVDTNARDYPFGGNGISKETELIGSHYETVAGGSAVNFCRLLQKFGLTSAFIGMAGSDKNGDTLETLLQESGIRSALIRESDLLTNISFNMTNPQGAHIMLVAGTANAALHPDIVFPKLGKIIQNTKILYLGSCFKLIKFADAFDQLIDLTKEHHVDLVVDHGRIPKDVSQEMLVAVKRLVQHAAYYFSSRDEFCQLWKVEDIEIGLQGLHKQTSQVRTIVKDSANGAYYWANGSVQHVDAVKVEKVIDVTGAGDSFNAGVMTAVVKGFTIDKAVTYGCEVAAAKISGKHIPHI